MIGADKEREEADGDATHRNAQSIFVGKINFQAEKELVYKTNRHCTLRRAPWKPVRSSQEYTAGQRLEIARKHLEAHPFLTVRTYCQLTGLLRSSGTVELRKLSHTPERASASADLAVTAYISSLKNEYLIPVCL